MLLFSQIHNFSFTDFLYTSKRRNKKAKPMETVRLENEGWIPGSFAQKYGAGKDGNYDGVQRSMV